jgi:GNAT superfamily N-acetyltransferase
MSNRIRLLEPSDVLETRALSVAVGWNQTPEDWRLAIEMNPGGCFAMEHEGALVATTTTIRYGTELAWIGMVLTHPEHRRRGYARSLMRCALDHLSDVETIKLDATQMGAPLYRQLGFEDECVIERWQGQAQLSPVRVQGYTDPSFDLEAFGADRGELLKRLSKIDSASLDDAFAMGRGDRFGPCVSRSKESALALARWYLGHHPSEQLVWDLFPENNLAQSLGFTRARVLTRMTKGHKLNANASLVYAGAGFEFG